ncbi:C13 family peptidase [Pleomorphomonas oryzae]|uniref:C13 family peptidase n=1 Tax=Pleomorphomonas oryzae TaxID=261934 RepID=UPI00040B4C18|nr:C13 family peptidase [Pleomorphomonas oryzae]
MAIFRAVLRCLSFRRFDPYDVPASPYAVLVGFFALILTNLFGQWVISQANWSFDEYGLTALVATHALYFILALVLFVGPNYLSMIAVSSWAFSVVHVVSNIVLLISLGLLAWTEHLNTGTYWLTLISIALVSMVWGLAVPMIVLRSYDPFHWRRPILATLGFLALDLASPFVIRFEPAFYSDVFAIAAPRTVWARLDDWLSPDNEGTNPDVDPAIAQAAEEAWYRSEWEQASVVSDSLARIAPTDPSKPTVFSISVGGMSEAVFDRESGSAAAIMDKLFHIGPHAIRLVNDQNSINTPVATLQTLARSIDTIGTRMNPERDALVLFITSHGGTTGVSLSGPHAHQSTIRPLDLRFALDRAGIKNRIIIVSACHSGVFVPLFSDERSAVFTASSTENVSFGCNDTNDWTYFGSAFFQHGLLEKRNLIGAFVRARELVWDWETKSQTHSNPQAHVGSVIAAQFPEILGDLADLKPFAPESRENGQANTSPAASVSN